MKTLIELEALEFVIKTHFDGNVTAFARELGVVPNAVHNWRARGHITTEHCPAIEVISRNHAKDDSEIVLCEQLRPLVEWGTLRLHPLTAEQTKKAVLAIRAAERKRKAAKA